VAEVLRGRSHSNPTPYQPVKAVSSGNQTKGVGEGESGEEDKEDTRVVPTFDSTLRHVSLSLLCVVDLTYNVIGVIVFIAHSLLLMILTLSSNQTWDLKLFVVVGIVSYIVARFIETSEDSLLTPVALQVIVTHWILLCGCLALWYLWALLGIWKAEVDDKLIFAISSAKERVNRKSVLSEVMMASSLKRMNSSASGLISINVNKSKNDKGAVLGSLAENLVFDYFSSYTAAHQFVNSRLLVQVYMAIFIAFSVMINLIFFLNVSQAGSSRSMLLLLIIFVDSLLVAVLHAASTITWMMQTQLSNFFLLEVQWLEFHKNRQLLPEHVDLDDYSKSLEIVKSYVTNVAQGFKVFGMLVRSDTLSLLGLVCGSGLSIFGAQAFSSFCNEDDHEWLSRFFNLLCYSVERK